MGGWKVLLDGWIFLPQAMGKECIQQVHEATHLGTTMITELVRRDFHIPNLNSTIESISKRCLICAKVNQRTQRLPEGQNLRGAAPGEHWELDFIELKSVLRGHKYLLVPVNTFSGWIKAFHTRMVSALFTTKIVSEVVLRFGIPLKLRSDNGPAFMAHMTQAVAKHLQIDWKLPCVYHP